MEMEPRPPAIGKKLWSVVRIVLFMLRKGLLKSKLIVDLQTLLKRSKLAGKALTNLMLHPNYSALSCRSEAASLSLVAPRDYEFSCSNSPAFPSYFYRRKNNHQQSHNHRAKDIVVVQKVFDMLNNEMMMTRPEVSPAMVLPGFGKSPVVRQLRVTDSPFPLLEEGNEEDNEEDKVKVDTAAEEFIKKFYLELKLQKRIAASPSPYHSYMG